MLFSFFCTALCTFSEMKISLALFAFLSIGCLPIYSFFDVSEQDSHEDAQNIDALKTDEPDESRVYDFTKCTGPGCPYTASWLAHTGLYQKTHWWMESTKMEAASFNMFDKAKFKFQVADPDAYYVHHMSMFEHLIHKKYGFESAQSKTLVLSKAAIHGECSNLTINRSIKNMIALVPFYGGLPPNVTSDQKVKSIGQGNSLVSFQSL